MIYKSRMAWHRCESKSPETWRRIPERAVRILISLVAATDIFPILEGRLILPGSQTSKFVARNWSTTRSQVEGCREGLNRLAVLGSSMPKRPVIVVEATNRTSGFNSLQSWVRRRVSRQPNLLLRLD